ncbi:MAG: 16S rRNA (cytosine(967)-C(5))-methyltransferase RsmB [Lachnospiraceae bacterium]|nr:16S rRNA (cytosine(967)-C(5))-methyltransferase RsmB [Lachnospiraceae bacterium]
MINTRDIVLNILMDIETNKTFSNQAISKALSKNQFEDKRDRAFITRLAEGVMEQLISLDFIINQFSKTKVNKCKPMIRCLLRMGAYQILYMESVPDSAACNESVKLAKSHGFSSLSGFVNGVLRNIARNKDNIAEPSGDKLSPEYLSIKYSMPMWLCKKLKKDYPKEYTKILEGCFLDRATSIRVNTTRISRDELRIVLEEAGITVEYGSYSDKALLISDYDFIKKVPGYKKGYFTVQDESSMCAIKAAGIVPGNTVIDVCAAPGGKTTCAAEYLNGQGKIYSMDISEDKLELIEENVTRLGFDNVDISCHDATELIADMEADVVIADVPCSGLGIIGRKNDIKYRLEEKQIDELIELQRRILSTVKQYVKDEGTLLYSTCTINPDENHNNLEWFLKENKEFYMVEERGFLQGIDTCDGFYYAVLKKR